MRMNLPRKRYENLVSLGNEKRVIEKITTKWRCGAEKLPISYGLDFALVDEKRKVKALAEIKVRSNPMDQYPTFFIAYHKISHAKMWNHPCFLIVQWTDDLGFISLKEEPAYVAMGGRRDRGDEADQEPMAHFYIKDFTRI